MLVWVGLYLYFLYDVDCLEGCDTNGYTDDEDGRIGRLNFYDFVFSACWLVACDHAVVYIDAVDV